MFTKPYIPLEEFSPFCRSTGLDPSSASCAKQEYGDTGKLEKCADEKMRPS
jgi:hypothetical protein